MLKPRSRASAVACITAGIVVAGVAFSQGRGGGSDWTTAQMNAQRTGWVKTDQYISKENFQKGGFQLQWKWKVDNQPRQMKSIISAVTTSSGIGRTISILSLTSNGFAAADDDTGNLYWARQIGGTTPASGTMACPGGLTAGASRSSVLVPPAAAAARGGFGGTRGPYTSAVGEPGEGVPSAIMQGGMFGPGGGARGGAAGGGAGAGRGGAAGAGGPGALGGLGAPGGPGGAAGFGGADAAARGSAPGPAGAPGAARGGPGGPGGFNQGPQGLYAVSNDGILHMLGQNAGKDLMKPVPFLPANANASDLIAVPETENNTSSNIVYAATMNSCGGVPNRIWAIDLASGAKTVVHYDTGASAVGSPALSSDGTLYVALGNGAVGSGHSHAVIALESKSLALKDYFTDPKADFSSTPMIVKQEDKEIVVAATKDGRVYLLDASSLGGSDHKTALYVSPAYSMAKTDYAPPALASWQDADGILWILEPFAGAGPAGLSKVSDGGVLALKLADEGGKVSLARAWVSPNLIAPVAPIVVNGVVFAASSGEYQATAGAAMSPAERAKKSVPAVLYALDASTGQQLWSSGKTIKSFIASTPLWATSGQSYVATYDNTVYAFGFAMDRLVGEEGDKNLQ